MSSGADPPPQPQDFHSSSSTARGPSSSARPAPESRHDSFPFSFRRSFQPNPSSTTLVSSTAEGKPIPVDDSTAEHRTSALRELNNNYPSRHRYAKSTGAQSSTYSEPVIVRSYYSPGPSRPVSTSRPGIAVQHGGATAAVAASESGGPSSAVRRVMPFASTAAPPRNGMLSNMARARTKKLLRAGAPEEPRLPPVEAFTFKSFLANMQDQDTSDDINADLDRIAEICARSRYSLSNQYEVHYQPHGSGSSFLAEARAQESQGPTLQAVSSDDERNMTRQRRRRGAARRNSRAMGTLETIMSSSRSSDEDKSKKKSAAEIAEEVRGRAARKGSGDTSPTTSSRDTLDSRLSQDDQSPSKAAPERRSAASLALIDGPRQPSTPGDVSSPRTSATALVGQPARPQASASQLEIRTAPEEPFERPRHRQQPESSRGPSGAPEPPVVTRGAVSSADESTPGGNLLSALSSWMPWRSPDMLGGSGGKAEGRLRELLKTTDVKGKGVDRIE